MRHSRYLRSAAVLAVGGILAKAIGALYRVPLSNLLGGYGTGLYQMAYPLFALLLTFSSTGIPSALARVVARETARGTGSGQTLKTALRLFALLGLCGTALMCLLAPRMSGLQGDENLLPCYLALAPSVFLAALIAVLRGYFQGKSDMAPTAVSGLLEQLVKAAAGIAFALRFRAEPQRAVAACLFAVTLSEGAALVYLLCSLRGREKRRPLLGRKKTGAELFFAVLPVMAATSLLPLSRTADSVLLVRLFARSAPDAVALYGLFSGSALSLVSLPASIAYGFAAAAVPAVSRAFSLGREEEGRMRALTALLFTFLFSVPCALGLFFLARPVVSLLYPALALEYASVLVSLVRLTSVSAVSLSATETLSACLTGMGRASKAAFSMLIAVSVKLVLQLLLAARFTAIGAGIAANACYLVAFFLDLFYTVKKKRERTDDYHHRIGRRERGREPAGALRDETRGQSARARRIARLGRPEGGGDLL